MISYNFFYSFMLVGRTGRGGLNKDLSFQNNDILNYHSGDK